MRIFNKKNIIKIAEDDLNDAKLSCIDFPDQDVAKRAFVDVLGARLAMKFLFSKKIEANNIYSMYTIKNILGQLDVADIYFENLKIDIRLVFNGNEIFIPKSHFKYDVLPDIYAILELKEDLASAEFMGFVEPKDINKNNENKDYYFVEHDELQNPENLKDFLKNFPTENNYRKNLEDTEGAETLFVSSIDNEISNQDRIFLLQQLAQSVELREKFVEFENFELISLNVAKNKEMFKDGVLDVIGAQKAFEEDAELVEINFEEPKNDDLLDLVEIEEIEEPKPTNNGNNIAGALAGGAIIAGAGIVAGGAMAAGAAAMAQAATAAGAETAVDVAATAGKVILDNITKTNEPEFDFDTKDVQVEDLIDDELLEEIADLTGTEEDTQEIEPQINSEEAVEQEFSIDNENIETLDELAELPPLEKLQPLNELQENFDLNNEINNDVQENDSDETVVDLADFDFNTFDETPDTSENITGIEDSEEFSNNESVEIANQDDTSDEAVSFDSLLEKDSEENINTGEEEIQKEEEFYEVDDNEIEDSEKNDEKEISSIASQVDEFLNDIELSETQKNILAGEFSFEDIENEVNSLNTPILTNGEQKEELIAGEKAQENLMPTIDLDEDLELLAPNENATSSNKDPLQALFKKEHIDENEELNLGERKSKPMDANQKKRLILVASVAGIMCIAGVAGVVSKHNSANVPQPNAPITADAQSPQAGIPDGSDITQANGLTTGPGQDPSAQQSQDFIGQTTDSSIPQATSPTRDMGKAVSEAFMSEPVNASVSKIAWEVPEELAYNDTFRQYLQTVGRNLKLSLQNDLLLASEMAYSNKVVLDLKIGRDGTVQSANTVVSSGSKQIDQIVLQSVKDTLKYLKMPTSELDGQSLNATLIINF